MSIDASGMRIVVPMLIILEPLFLIFMMNLLLFVGCRRVAPRQPDVILD